MDISYNPNQSLNSERLGGIVGIIGSVFGAAAKEAAKVAGHGVGLVGAVGALEVVEKVSDAYDKVVVGRQVASMERIVGNNPDALLLRIKQDPLSAREYLQVFDGYNQPKYLVRGSLLSAKPSLTIYDEKKRKVGSVKQKLLSIRSPLSFDGNPEDFAIEINGKSLGYLSSLSPVVLAKDSDSKSEAMKKALTMRAYEFSFNHWRAVRESFTSDIEIYDENGMHVARVERVRWSSDDHYIASYYNPDHDLLVLIATLALDAHRDAKTKRSKIVEAFK